MKNVICLICCLFFLILESFTQDNGSHEHFLAGEAFRRKDYKEFVRLLKLANEKGDPFATVELGELYEKGLYVQQDSKEAVKWYKIAIERGVTSVEFRIAYMYDSGIGVLRDPKEAMKWYKIAAENDFDQNSSVAQYNIGLLYLYGEGVLKDLSKAKYWMKRAYENEYKDAQKIWDKYELWKY